MAPKWTSKGRLEQMTLLRSDPLISRLFETEDRGPPAEHLRGPPCFGFHLHVAPLPDRNCGDRAFVTNRCLSTTC
ncbi:protein of unknown function (plasmid) [Caballeronia sp. S22]